MNQQESEREQAAQRLCHSSVRAASVSVCMCLCHLCVVVCITMLCVCHCVVCVCYCITVCVCVLLYVCVSFMIRERKIFIIKQIKKQQNKILFFKTCPEALKVRRKGLDVTWDIPLAASGRWYSDIRSWIIWNKKIKTTKQLER